MQRSIGSPRRRRNMTDRENPEAAAGRIFPIMGVGYQYRDEIAELRREGCCVAIVGVPWSLLAPHEKQAIANHGQTLKDLAERGGLGVDEAIDIIEGRRYGGRRMTPPQGPPPPHYYLLAPL